MRPIVLAAIVPALSACEPPPRADTDPPLRQPEVMQREAQRLDHLSGAAQAGDFKVNFREPFVQFENRGDRLAIGQSYGGPGYRVVDVTVERTEGTTVLRGKEGAIPGEPPFVLTIEKRPCANPYTGENTAFMAWLGTAGDPRKAATCAAPAR